MTRHVSRTQALLIGAIVVLFAAGALGARSCLDARAQRDQLQAQLTALQRSRERGVDRTPQTPTRSSSARQPASPVFPKELPSITLMDLALRSAAEERVQVLGLRTTTPTTEQLGTSAYRATRLELRLRATPAQLSGFLQRLEDQAPPTMVVEGFDTSQNGTGWEVLVKLVVYAQRD